MTPIEFRDMTLGKAYDIDHAYGYQCWDYFAYSIAYFKLPVSTYCGITGYVCDLWFLKEQYQYDRYFNFVYDRNAICNGDWCIWDMHSSHPMSHIAMYIDGQEVGQNQTEQYVTQCNTTFDILGALRPKYWACRHGYAERYDPDIAGQYRCMYPLKLRTGGGINYSVLTVMPAGSTVHCYGYYHVAEDSRIWFYVTYQGMTGFACMEYLSLP